MACEIGRNQHKCWVSVCYGCYIRRNRSEGPGLLSIEYNEKEAQRTVDEGRGQVALRPRSSVSSRYAPRGDYRRFACPDQRADEVAYISYLSYFVVA